MARLEQALQLRQLAQRLAASGEETIYQPALVFSCLAKLQKARPHLIAGLRTSLGQRARQRSQHPKLKLWQSLAAPDQVWANDVSALLAAIRQTDAWQQAYTTDERRRSVWSREPWNHQTRLDNASELIKNLESAFRPHQAVKLFFWHHFDALGFVPQSWHNVLAALTQKGWVVVVSSSGLTTKSEESLLSCGCLISKRQNLGLCLGAYRDFSCLLYDHRNLRDRIETLVLCNDSTLPMGGDEPFCQQAEQIHQELKSCKPKLIGLTDSVQTNLYHVQSYFLALNSGLLNNINWTNFWNKFDPRGHKNDLIQRGEVGLTQWLLRHKISTKAIYSLASILLKSATVNQELKQLDLRQPTQINTTLMCWGALLSAGCPVIKKQLLLEPPDFLAQSIPMAELRTHLTSADKALMEDLEHLLQSRFFSP